MDQRIRSWLVWYGAALLLLTLLAWSVSLVRGRFLGWPPRYSTLLYRPDLRFSDLTQFSGQARHPIGQGESIEAGKDVFNLPAPAIFAYALFAWGGAFAPAVLIAAIAATALVASGFLLRELVSSGLSPPLTVYLLAISLLSSYPLLFEFDRANIEGFIWILLVSAFLLLSAGHATAAAMLVMLAGTIKPFPLILLVIFLFHRRFRDILIAALAWCGINWAAFALAGPTLRRCFDAYVAGTRGYVHIVAAAYRGLEMNIDHSVFALIKQAINAYLRARSPGSDLNAILIELYLPYLAAAGCVCLYVLYRAYRLPVLNQIFACVLCILIFPPASYDYTLIELYIPFALFLIWLVKSASEAGSRAIPERNIVGMLVCFGIIFTPQTFIRGHGIGIGGQVKLLPLLALLVLSLGTPMITPLDRIFRAGSRAPEAD